MYSTEAKRVFIKLYESATAKLASAYCPPKKGARGKSREGQSNETSTKR